MKILLVHNFYEYRGGEDLYVLWLRELLFENGHTVVLYTKDNKRINGGLWGKIKVGINLFYNRGIEQEITDILSKEKPDIIHVHNVYPLITPIFYRVCKKLSYPVVQTIHNYRFICPGLFMFNNGKICIHATKSSILRKFFHKCYKDSYLQSFVFSFAFYLHKIFGTFSSINTYIFPAPFVRDIHQRLAGIPLEKSEVLSYMIRDNKMSREYKKRDYFLYVGRLSQEKGILSLLEIFAREPELKLIVIGYGPLFEEVSKYKKFKNISIKPSVSRKKILTHMGEAVFTIIPSGGYETGPIVMIESFAMGTPVIVPKMGVFKDAVTDGVNGLFFKYNDQQDLRLKILQAWKRKNTISKLSMAARRTFVENYSDKSHLKKLMEVYKEHVSRSSFARK